MDAITRRHMRAPEQFVRHSSDRRVINTRIRNSARDRMTEDWERMREAQH